MADLSISCLWTIPWRSTPRAVVPTRQALRRRTVDRGRPATPGRQALRQGPAAVRLAAHHRDVAGRLGVIVAAREQPRFAAHGEAAELSLGGVVSQREAAIVEEAGERAALAMGIAEGGAQHAALIH